MALVLSRYGDPDPAARLEPARRSPFAVDPVRLRNIWSEAREELGIPAVSPVPLPRPRVWGVGGRTPS